MSKKTRRHGGTPKTPRFHLLAIQPSRNATVANIALGPRGGIRLLDTEGTEIPLSSAKVELHTHAPGRGHVLASVPLDPRSPELGMCQRLRDFTTIVGVDTNTYRCGVEKVSLISMCTVTLTPDTTDQAMARAEIVPWAVIELRDLQHPAERFGWYLACETVVHAPMYRPTDTVALVVDSDFGIHDEVNARTTAILDDYFLPPGFTLVKGDDTSRTDSLPQMIIHSCDTHARRIQRELESTQPLHPFHTLPWRYPFAYRKWLFGNIQREDLGDIVG